MDMKRRATALLLAVGLVLPMLVSTDAQSRLSTEMLQHSNADADSAGSQSLDAIVARIKTAQSEYNMSLVQQLADTCEREAISQRDTTQARYCNGVAIGAASTLGNPHMYLAEQLWRRIHLTPHASSESSRAPSAGSSPFPDLSADKLKRLVAKTPVLSSLWKSDSASVPVDHANAFTVTEPKIPVHINHHQMDGVIIAGSAEPTPIILFRHSSGVEKSGSPLGLKPLFAEAATRSDANSGLNRATGTSVQWSLADSIEVGPMVLHHVMVMVIFDDKSPARLYITPALLRRFGEVVVDEDQVIFRRDSTGDCRSESKIYFAGDNDENGWLVFPVLVGRSGGVATFMSGMRAPLQGAEGVLLADAPSSTKRTETSAKRMSDPPPVHVGAEDYRAKYAVLHKKVAAPFEVAIGNPVLRAFSVHLVFDDGWPTICLSESNH